MLILGIISICYFLINGNLVDYHLISKSFNHHSSSIAFISFANFSNWFSWSNEYLTRWPNNLTNLSDSLINEWSDEQHLSDLKNDWYLWNTYSILFASDFKIVLWPFILSHIFDIVTLCISIFMLTVCTLNLKYIKTTNDTLNKTLVNLNEDAYKISVLVAARNEENSIERCVRSLMNQSYSNYELLVMNDNSSDSTGKILKVLKDQYDEKAIQSNGTLNYFTNDYLPSNWYGKSWSIQCLSKKATGEIFIITDADTIHNYDSIRFIVHSLIANKVDFLSGKIGLKIKNFNLVYKSNLIKSTFKVFQSKI